MTRPVALQRLALTGAVLSVAASASAQSRGRRAPAPPAQPAMVGFDWRATDPENVLVIDTTKGRILVEMSPEAAPEHVARIKLLARQKFYDGVVFHRVIDWFMSQTG